MLCTVGVLQALAAYYGWRGLLFFRQRPRLGYLVAAVLIPASYYWFFSLTNRNVEGLEGWQLFSRFAVGVVAGLVVVLVISSIANASMARSPERLPPGLDALRHNAYLQTLWPAIGGEASIRRQGEGEMENG
jgi:hypothetical protein